MAFLSTLCVKFVGGKLTCSKCSTYMLKYGKTTNKKQRFFCKNCKKTQLESYTYKAYQPTTNQNIIALTKEGVGILATAWLLQISATTVLKRIKKIATQLVQPAISKGKIYEVDEMRTFIKSKDKLIWIVYALEKETKKVVSFNVGSRSNKTLNVVLKTLKLSEASTIFTDKLKNYQYLIDKKIHSTKFRGTNHIERNNLTIRTHLKRLNRKTLAFSKSAFMLSSILKIYFYG